MLKDATAVCRVWKPVLGVESEASPATTKAVQRYNEVTCCHGGAAVSDATKNNDAKPTFRLQPVPVNVPPDDPFKNDLLSRKDFGEALATSLASIDGACVIAVNGRWGTGKTTFVNMFTQHLRKRKFTVVEINAWETDYADAPLAALSSAVEQEIEGEGRPEFKAAAARLLRVVAPPLIRLATQGLLDIDANLEKAASEGISGWANASLQRFEEHQESLCAFRKTLARVAARSDQPLVVVVDELDRCRPTYAVEFLETIKHVFDVDGVAFVLAVNREQLDQSAAILYGSATDPESYFRRFFDIELTLPDPDRHALVRTLLERFGLPTDDVPAEVLAGFLAAAPYGIRALQQTIQHYAIAWGALRQYEERAWWWMLPTLMILRLTDEPGYRALRKGKGRTRKSPILSLRLTGPNRFEGAATPISLRLPSSSPIRGTLVPVRC